ncbi:MAG: TIR domain-containing protein [Candidatus Zixiibacteriota bacterium]
MNITELTRRSIIDYLLLREHPFHGKLDILDFLKRIWDLSSMPSTDSRFQDAEGDIWQHMVRNNDWEDDYLLYTYLDLLKCNDETFLKFLETCLHPVVLRDEEKVSETLSEFNEFLAPDGFRLEVSSEISGRPLYKAIKLDVKKGHPSAENSYEVVLSFAGEDREYVEEVARFLKDNNVRVFYDKYEEVTLWGKDLAEHLDKVYRGSARYCVMFISKHYADKVWTSHERRSALAKAIEEKEEYILPARFDDTEIPGLRQTIRYVDLSEKSPDELGNMILQKLGRLAR